MSNMLFWIRLLSIPILVIITYWRTLKNHYVVDDLMFFTFGEEKDHRPENFWVRLWRQFCNRGLWDDNPKSKDPKERNLNRQAHAIMMAQHALVCITIFLVFGRDSVAYLAALLFAFNPSNHEGSIWLGGKAYSGTTFLVLVAWALPYIAPAIYAISFTQFMTINAASAPLMFLTLPGWWKLLALCFLIVVYPMIRKRGILDPEVNVKLSAYVNKETNEITNEAALNFNLWNIIRVIKFYGYYLSNAVLAIHTPFYHEYMQDFASTKQGIKEANQPDKFFWIGVIALYVLACNLDIVSYPVIFGLLWFTFNIAMFCNFINIGQQYITSRYQYLANVGIMYALAYILVDYPLVAGGLLMWYLRGLIPVMDAYKNAFWHTHYDIVFAPDNYYTWLMHGNMHFARGQFDSAVADYTQSNDCRPNIKAFYNMSGAYVALGDLDKAILNLEEAKKMDLTGQERTKENCISERENLIGTIIDKQKRKIPIKLDIKDIGILV
jgi:tetratricopeptide (TPR) repeat protein